MAAKQAAGFTAEQLQAAIGTLASPDVVDSPFGGGSLTGCPCRTR
jgi:hypothetical protein